jgi:hypothetical protein
MSVVLKMLFMTVRLVLSMTVHMNAVDVSCIENVVDNSPVGVVDDRRPDGVVDDSPVGVVDDSPHECCRCQLY